MRFSLRGKVVLLLVAAVTALVAPLPASAADSPPVRSCAGLTGSYDIPGAPTRVDSAAEVAGTPAYCEVLGTIAPEIKFQLKLPLRTWGGRYLQYGCGGFCGLFSPSPFPDCGPGAGDFAVAVTNDGHVGHGPFGGAFDASWAAHNRAARDDFDFRAPHALSLSAKRIIAAFYGTPPRDSYFAGCSDGGREGLLLAQRYPRDFNGVIAGAPAADWGALVGVYETWLARSNMAAGGTPILTAAKLPALHQAVLNTCDRLDGLVDGQLDDPRLCHFDPAALTCPAGTDTPACLTPAQVGAVRKIYAGPTDEHGVRLYPGGEPLGSELAWDVWLIPNPLVDTSSEAASIGDNYLRFAAYPIGAPTSSLADFRFIDREFFRLTAEAVRADAMSTDLSAFRRAGGKLIIWHGFADQAISPFSTLDYYARLTQRSGGLAATQEFARLFMVPSMFHCIAGEHLSEFNPIRELVAWVEHGVAPERVVATGRDPVSGTVTRTRPVFPYPTRAAYDGTGSIDDASNFRPAPPLSPLHDTIHWLGDYLYGIPGPVARP